MGLSTTNIKGLHFPLVLSWYSSSTTTPDQILNQAHLVISNPSTVQVQHVAVPPKTPNTRTPPRMKISTITALLTFTLPLAHAWTLTACGQTFTGTGSGSCTAVSCPAGSVIDFAAETDAAIELNLYTDNTCGDEITHFADDVQGYVLTEALGGVLVLT
ncbi:hypothetical protein BDV19DRAFT_354673 [Aspergillus venezuelensis]